MEPLLTVVLAGCGAVGLVAAAALVLSVKARRERQEDELQRMLERVWQRARERR